MRDAFYVGMTDNRYIIARNTEPERAGVEYWTGKVWSPDKTTARVYRTLQAVDKAKVDNPERRNLYVTE